MSKLTSRKFWISIAAFLASIGASITGLTIQEPAIVTVGVICTVLSAAIYAAAEAYVDGASAGANGTSKIITATTNSTKVVQAAFNSEPVAEPANSEVQQ